MGNSQPWDSVSTIAPRRAIASEILREDFKRRQMEQKRRIEFIFAQTELLRQKNALLWTQLTDQRAHIHVLYLSTSNLDHLHQQDNNEVVEPLDHVVPLS